MAATAEKVSGRWFSTLINVGFAGIALAGIVLIQSDRLNRGALNAIDAKQAEQEEALRLNVLKQAPTFGFNNLISDWTFLNFLQYFGDEEARQKTGYDLNSEYFDVITRLDPRFAQSYLFLSNSVSYYQGNPELAVALMERGTKALSPQVNPTSFIVWRYKGLDELLLLGDIPAAINSYEMAAKWTLGTSQAYLAPIFQQTADFLKQDPNSVPARFQSWLEVYLQAKNIGDRRTQERAEQALFALGAQKRTNDKGETYFVLPATFQKKQNTQSSQTSNSQAAP
jgi:hypothetical protein